MSTRFVTRFAPSPTGYLHRGHAFSALTAHQAARSAGGQFILRIEDIDQVRCRPQFEAAVAEDLAWLGLAWPRPVRRQSEHMADYRRVLGHLAEAGLVYRCFRTRREIAEDIEAAPHGAMEAWRGEPLAADEETRRLAAGEPYAWRLSLTAAERALGGFDGLTFQEEGAGPNGEAGVIQIRPELGGDVVLARKDVGVAYHLAVVADDALQGVTHVIRGHDLFEAAHVHRLLQALLGFPVPTYRHHPLLTAPDGKRFAKRDRAETLRELRERGMTPEDLRGELDLD
ncbi:MAG: tRNA glutamyl-Q(34) synthetase GluQRS [Phenylobacterium sp.]